MILVLLTAVARSYDQTWIGENPFLWLLGPLLFSLVSGTWLFFVVYIWFLRANLILEYQPDSSLPPKPDPEMTMWRDWPAFMGLFWMTAPIAWLYAIPVERLLDSIGAAWANVSLLGIVALWRVLLFSRVVQVTAAVRFRDAITWVLFAASVEVGALGGLGFLKAVASGMGGLRHSPEEEILVAVGSLAMIAAMPLFLICAIASSYLRLPNSAQRLPVRKPGNIPWRFLAAAAAFWLALALLAQPAVHRSATADRLVREERHREALDFLAARQPTAFAPARPLPPRVHERETFRQLAGLLAAVRGDEPEWPRQHLLRRLDEAVDSLTRGASSRVSPEKPEQESAKGMVFGINHSRIGLDDLRAFAEVVATAPWLSEWRAENRPFLIAFATHAESKSQNRDGEGWKALLETFGKAGIQPIRSEKPPTSDELLLDSAAPAETNPPAP
ncbi:MAG: hypothetical protein ACKVYV_03595 [Limisphaerales bacterium]